MDKNVSFKDCQYFVGRQKNFKNLLSGIFYSVTKN
jgi:hypothetical protein